MNELQRLRQRVEELETLLEIGEQHIPPGFRCGFPSSNRTGIIAALLIKREIVTRDTIQLAIGTSENESDSTPVYIAALRKFLRPFGIQIKTAWNTGWYLEPEDRKRLSELLETEKSQHQEMMERRKAEEAAALERERVANRISALDKRLAYLQAREELGGEQRA
jgi:hypothetical protein